MAVFRPILYERDTATFNDNGLGVLSDGADGRCTENLNGSFEIKITYPISGINYKNLAVDRVILAKPNRYDDPQPFRIYRIERSSSNFVNVYAEHKHYELSGYPCLPNDEYIETAGSCSSMMQYLTTEAAKAAAALGTPAYTFSTDIVTTAKWVIEGITDIKSAMAIAVQYFGGEWKINGTNCQLLQRRGEDRDVKVQYGSNMQSITQNEVDTSFSHIMPYWTDGTETVYITGNYLAVTGQSEPLRKHILIVNLTTECNAKKADEQASGEKPTPAELLTVAQEWLANNPPKANEKSQRVKFIPRGQTVEYAHLEDIDHVELGDTISTENNPLNVSTSQRCISLVYDIYKDIYIDSELGIPVPSLTAASAKEATKREVTVWVSTTEPTEGYQSGDYWIKIDNEVTRVAQALGRYSGGKWLLMCEFAGGSGVGEDLGDHNERFNDYENNTVTGTSSYNHVEGSYNTVDNSYYVHLSGYGNTVRNGARCTVSGERNNALGFQSGSMTGYNNNFGGSYHMIGGSSNSGGGTANIVGGQENTVGAAECIVSGRSNNVSSDRCIVNGDSNIVSSGANSIINGFENVVTASYSVTCGRYNVNSASNSVMCGDYGSNSSYPLAVGGGTSSARSNIFYVDLSGSVYAKGGYNTIGADYAEYFEWADGNPENEDRRGMLVSLKGDRIVPAHGDNILGAVSARPSVVGNAYEEYWHGKYKTDVFGAFVTDKDGKPILSEDYDPNREYMPRSKRPEWAAVGLVGRLIVADNGKCAPGGYVSARSGKAVPTLTQTKIMCLKRIDSAHIEILVR